MYTNDLNYCYGGNSEPDARVCRSVRLCVNCSVWWETGKSLEQAWKTASSTRDSKTLIVDLTGTLYIDEEGKRVLTNLFRDGALFRTSGTMTTCIVDEITGKSRKSRRSILRWQL